MDSSAFIKYSGIMVLFCLLFFRVPDSFTQIKVLPGGDMIAFDGEYYDYRDSAGVQMIKMWIPPGIETIRGVFISGHGGGGGDSRDFARDENIRAFAARLGFAVAGLHNFPGRRVYEQGARFFFNALKKWSEFGQHPEIANLPFVIYGSSNGGATTYGFVNYAPERAICFVSNVAAGSNPEIPVDEALKVPGIFIMGQFDALIGQRGIDRTAELMNYARNKGALWSWAIEMKGHEDGASFDVYMKMVEQAVLARYPAEGDLRAGPLRLKQIPEESGWLVDPGTWTTGLTLINSYEKYAGDKKKAGWVLNEDMAYVYRSLSTHFNPLGISVREFDRTINPHTDPGTMFSLGGPVLKPGERITIQFNTDNIPDWKSIELFDGADKLGSVSRGHLPEISLIVEPGKMVYCLTALSTDQYGIQRTCTPLHFFVEDTALQTDFRASIVPFEHNLTRAGSKNAASRTDTFPVNPGDSVLVAYGLSPVQEKQFSTLDNEKSGFWTLFTSNHDSIHLTARNNSTEGAAFNGVLTHDCAMTVKAAYGSDGVYILFDILDDNDVVWPNHYSGTQYEQFYLNYDAVDLIFDSRSLQDICSPEHTGLFISKNFGLTVSSTQYQIGCGSWNGKPGGFKRAIADPWDFHSTFFSFEEAQTYFGIRVENIKTGHYTKAMELFIPWKEFGSEFNREPDPGSRMAFTAGFNDRDEGEHFSPGVTSSGGSVKASNSIRWIGRSDPWGTSKKPYAWGEIELGPVLK